MLRGKTFQVLISYLLALIFLFTIGGYLFLFFAQLHQIKKEEIVKIQGGIEVEELVRITVDKQTASDLTWIEDHEFRLEGKMYDIVYSERSSTNTVYYCYSDSQETELYAALNRVIKRLKNHRKNSIVKIIKVFRNNSENTIHRFGKSFEKNHEIVDTYLMIYKDLPSKVSVPPPKFS